MRKSRRVIAAALVLAAALALAPATAQASAGSQIGPSFIEWIAAQVGHAWHLVTGGLLPNDEGGGILPNPKP